MRIAFLGAGAFGLPTLESLASGHQIVGVVTQPDRPAGRGRELAPTPIGAWCAAHAPGVPLLKPADVNAPEVMAEVRGWPAEAWVIIAFGQKLSNPLIEGRFAINLHASLLPRWRGAAPINAAILAGDEVTGNSVITIADRMDAGLVLGQSRRAIDPGVTAGELHDALAGDGPALMLSVLEDFARGRVSEQKQDETLVTRAKKLSRADAWLDFSRPAVEARRRVHGLTPWPGVSVNIAGVEAKLLRVRDEAGGASSPGTLDAREGTIACGNGTALRVLEVQPAGGKPMAWPAFARGRTLSADTPIIVRAGSPPC